MFFDVADHPPPLVLTQYYYHLFPRSVAYSIIIKPNVRTTVPYCIVPYMRMNKRREMKQRYFVGYFHILYMQYFELGYSYFPTLLDTNITYPSIEHSRPIRSTRMRFYYTMTNLAPHSISDPYPHAINHSLILSK